jgi:hypothetical protein
MRHALNLLLRHAIAASKVAAIGEGDSQVIVYSMVGICKHIREVIFTKKTG